MSQKKETSTPKLRILIAEDDIDDQEIMKETIQEINPLVEVLLVSSGLKAVKTLKAAANGELPHLIILDYNMPELNGAQVLEALAGDPRFANIPKVVLSTSSSPYYKSACLDLGAQGYFTKPSSFTELESLMRIVLDFCKQ